MCSDLFAGASNYPHKLFRIERVIGELGVTLVRVWGVVTLILGVHQVRVSPGDIVDTPESGQFAVAAGVLAVVQLEDCRPVWQK